MFLYKLECAISEHGQSFVFIVANDDLTAFEFAEQFVKKQFLKQITIEETVIVEKKPICPGAGYAIFPAAQTE